MKVNPTNDFCTKIDSFSRENSNMLIQDYCYDFEHYFLSYDIMEDIT